MKYFILKTPLNDKGVFCFFITIITFNYYNWLLRGLGLLTP